MTEEQVPLVTKLGRLAVAVGVRDMPYALRNEIPCKPLVIDKLCIYSFAMRLVHGEKSHLSLFFGLRTSLIIEQGIYVSYLTYGILQEWVFHHRASDGSKYANPLFSLFFSFRVFISTAANIGLNRCWHLGRHLFLEQVLFIQL